MGIVERMSRSLRGSNHPVVAWMLRRGQEEHLARQEKCHASEVVLESGKKVDCVMASGSSCLVIELKPDNSRAISRGNSQARGYSDELNRELKNEDSQVIKKLVAKNSDFGKCERFEEQVD